MSKELLSAFVLDTSCERQIKGLWPAMKGSLAKINKPCIRKTCAACARGDKHPAWILATSQKGRRRCMYVPEELVPVLKQAIQNGRKLEKMLSDTGPALVKAYRSQRDTQRNSRD